MLKKRIDFKISYLKSLLDLKNSCITVVKNFRGNLSLLPFHLGYLKHAVKELLNNKVTKYDPELNGFILGHSNIKVINFLSHSDSGNLNLSYISDVYIFTPSVGQTLSGVINKKSKEHMGCLVHSAFNASIPKPRTAGEALSIWIRTIDSAQIGDELEFTISKVDFASRVPYISGIILNKEGNFDEEGEDSGVCCQDSLNESIKIKKKKRKSRTDSQSDALEDVSKTASYYDPDQVSELLNAENNVKATSRKRKAHSQDLNSDPSISSPPVKKKKEKIKLEPDSEIPNSSNLDYCGYDSLPVPADRIKKEKKCKMKESNLEDIGLKKIKEELPDDYSSTSYSNLNDYPSNDTVDFSFSEKDSKKKKKRKKLDSNSQNGSF